MTCKHVQGSDTENAKDWIAIVDGPLTGKGTLPRSSLLRQQVVFEVFAMATIRKQSGVFITWGPSHHVTALVNFD